MLIKTRGIVLRSVKYSESSLIVDVYTEEKGLRSYIVSGVRSKKARVRASLLQVLSLVNLVAYDRHEKGLNRVKEISASYVYHSLPFEVQKGASGLFMAEMARKAIREPEENRRLFDFLYRTFQFLDETLFPIANLHLVFLLELSGYLGFLPTGAWTEDTPFFDLEEGVFSPEPPQHSHYLREQESQLLHKLLETDMAHCHLLKMERQERQALLGHLLDFYRYHIEGLPEIHAHLVLREVLGG